MKILIKGINLLIIIIFGFVSAIFILRYKPITVLSGSMQPTFSPGDIIIVKTTKVDSINSDDIITFETSPNILITHRVYKVINEKGIRTYITKGDANNLADQEYVFPEQIFGKYIFRVPYGGYFIKFIRSWIGIVIFIIIPAAVFTAEEIKRIILGLLKK